MDLVCALPLKDVAGESYVDKFSKIRGFTGHELAGLLKEKGCVFLAEPQTMYIIPPAYFVMTKSLSDVQGLKWAVGCCKEPLREVLVSCTSLMDAYPSLRESYTIWTQLLSKGI